MQITFGGALILMAVLSGIGLFLYIKYREWRDRR